ncbi:hypothetical protein TNCT_366881 [Trichonephila clavata]|uniref:Uncharacterized protein n=1 Tax=Trichonephila clavata TaxID=2740835 RepID=A0A8X6K8K8_TRICU|nr:hypothetical protein TNCT_366881 [Trichonephila clavata]
MAFYVNLRMQGCYRILPVLTTFLEDDAGYQVTVLEDNACYQAYVKEKNSENFVGKKFYAITGGKVLTKSDTAEECANPVFFKLIWYRFKKERKE